MADGSPSTARPVRVLRSACPACRERRSGPGAPSARAPRHRATREAAPPRRGRAGSRPDADRSAHARGLRSSRAPATARAASRARPPKPSICSLLDVMLPRLSGFDVLRELRQRGIETPVIMLTARGQVVDKVVGLKLGADDYVTKPFEMVELLARIEAQLRRDAASAPHPARGLPVRRRARRLPARGGHAGPARRSSCRRASSSCCATSSSTAARRSRATSC